MADHFYLDFPRNKGRARLDPALGSARFFYVSVHPHHNIPLQSTESPTRTDFPNTTKASKRVRHPRLIARKRHGTSRNG